MAANEKSGDEKQALGPSVVLGLVGAIVVLVLLGAGIWGVSKIVSKIRESSEDEETSETVAQDEEKSEEENGNEENQEESEESEQEESEGGQEETQQEEENQEEGAEETTSEESTSENVVGKWVANNYKAGDIGGDKYTVVRGDTLWEIAEARYGSGFEWKKILEANEGEIGYHPSIGWAVIVPGQVLTLPE